MEVIQRLHRRDILPKHMLFQVPRQLVLVVTRKGAVTYVKHIIQLLQSQRLRLRQQEVCIHEAEEVPYCVPCESALGTECFNKRRPCKREDEVEAPAGCGGEGHADVADVKGEGFGGVGEWDGSFAWRVYSHEDKNCGGDRAGASGWGWFLYWASGDQEGHAAPEETETHEREGGEKEVAPAEGVDCVYSGNGEDKVGCACAERHKKSLGAREAGIYEDGST